MQRITIPHCGRLYRIMRFDRVVQIFEKRQLTFSRPSTWEDPYETHFWHPDSERTYAQCWCARGVSDAMWRIYSPDRLGVRISTSTRTLRTALRPEVRRLGLDYREGGVEYLKPYFLRQRISEIRTAVGAGADGVRASDALFLKRDAFDHEHEYRIVLTGSATGNGSASASVSISCNPHKLIDSILLDPRAPPELANALVYYFKEKLGFRRRVELSALYKAPPAVSAP